MAGKVYRSRNAGTRMSAVDWAIAVAIGAPYALFLLVGLAVVVLG